MKRNRTRIGRIFTRLTVESLHSNSPSNDGNHYYNCTCSCGNTCVARWKNMVNGHKKSCGCLQLETVSALKAMGEANRAAKKTRAEEAKKARVCKSSHPLWSTWKKMLSRCYDPTHDSWKYYGHRGISVCDRWVKDFWAFVEDMGDRPSGCSLDRIDADGNYEPQNCRWATKLEQYSHVRNTPPIRIASLRGKTAAVSDWCRVLGVSRNTVHKKMQKGDSAELALLTTYFNKRALANGEKRSQELWDKCRKKAIAALK